MWRRFHPLVVVIVVLVFAGFSTATETLKVGHVGHDHQIALYVAADAGKALEKEYGVYLRPLKDREVYELYDGGNLVGVVHFVRVGGGSKMPAALEQGHIEVGLGGLAPTAKFIDKGAPLKVLLPLNNDGDALVVKKDMPVSSWKEFIRYIKESPKPVRVGYKAPMAVAYMIFIRALDEEGIRYGQEPTTPDGKPVQVITVNLHGLKNALPSLEAGVVDAVVVNEPMVSILEHKGVGKRVADLAELPPYPKWKGHPCCVVAANEKALKEKPGIIKSLLKAIIAGSELIKKNLELAFKAEARWTKTPPEVGKKSILNVDYLSRPTKKWIEGVDTWIVLMQESGHFKKRLKGKTTEEVKKEILDLDVATEAMKELSLKAL